MKLQSRREILSLSGSLVAASLAGCIGDNTAGEKDDADDEENSHDDHEHEDDPDHNSEDDHSHDRDYELGQPEDHIEVEMVSEAEGEHHFMPHLAHVEKGGTVEWVVESGTHNTVAYHPNTHGDQQRIPVDADPWESDLLTEDGDTFARTFDHEGVYDYACLPHEDQGMVGSIIVGWPDPEDQPGLSQPSDTLPQSVYEQFERYNEQVHDLLENGDHDD